MPPPAQVIIKHLGLRLAVVMAAWGMKAVARRLHTGTKKGGRRAACPASKQQASGKQQPPEIRFIWDPARDYKASNPKWLVEAAQWTPDSIPAELLAECPALTTFKEAVASGKFTVQVGSQECRQMFALDPSFAYLNHGSYGAAYRLGLEVQQWYRQQLELEPVRFMETTGVAGLVKAVADVAAFVGADWRDVVPVSNATTAVNTVVNSIKLKRGDLLLVANTTYPAVRSTLAHAAAQAGAGLLDITFELDDLLDDDRIVSCFKLALKAAGRRLKLVVIDHIVSFPPVMMPVKQICELCRAAGVPVMVDGAHAVGAVADLDVPSLSCQYYTTNLHKWMCTPKGAALLWVHPSKQDEVRPLVVSHGYGLGFRAEYLWHGTSDPTAWLTASACVTVLNGLQLHRVVEYNHGLVRRAAAMLQTAWGTKLVIGIGQDGDTAGMVAIEMPWPLNIPKPSSTSSVSTVSSSRIGSHKSSEMACNPDGNSTNLSNGTADIPVAVNGLSDGHQSSAANAASLPTPADAVAVNKHLRQQHKIEVPVACVEGMLFCRISAQIYNHVGDYQRLADAVLGLVER